MCICSFNILGIILGPYIFVYMVYILSIELHPEIDIPYVINVVMSLYFGVTNIPEGRS